MKRRIGVVLLVLAAAAGLPGCALSLFSREEGADDERLADLERRMDRAEEHLPQR